MELQEVINKRRSIRIFTKDIITDEELKYILNSAKAAPSWNNTQVWEFIVVKDPNLLAQLQPYSCTTLIVACVKMNISGLLQNTPVTKFQEWFMFDIGTAVQNLCLSAVELGLGTVICATIDHEQYKNILCIPEGYEVVVAIPIGRYTSEPSSPGRKPIENFVHLNKFGEMFVK